MINRAVLSCAAAIALVLIVVGCGTASPTAPSATGEGSKNASPPGVERAAESTWNAFLVAYVRALTHPDEGPMVVKPYATAAEYKYIASEIDELRDKGARLNGQVTSKNFVLQNSDRVSSLVCVVNGSSRFVDRAGKDVTPKDRPASATLRIVFAYEEGRLLVDRDESWEKNSVC